MWYKLTYTYFMGFILFRIILNLKNRKKTAQIKSKMCLLPVMSYDIKSDSLNYGQCFSVDVKSISDTQITVLHNDRIKKGSIFSLKTKKAINSDNKCVKCLNYKNMPENLKLSSMVGKVIWRNCREAVIEILMMKEEDKTYIQNIAKNISFANVKS